MATIKTQELIKELHRRWFYGYVHYTEVYGALIIEGDRGVVEVYDVDDESFDTEYLYASTYFHPSNQKDITESIRDVRTIEDFIKVVDREVG